MSESPTYNQTTIKAEPQRKKMSFYEALEQVLKDKKITKSEWGSTEIYGHIKDNVLMLHKEDGNDYQWIISTADMTGEDWFIL